MAETRKGRQTPTQSVTLPYWETRGGRLLIVTMKQAEPRRNGRSF